MDTQQIRPIRIEGNIAFVPLTQGYTAIIDVSDADVVAAWNWCAFVCPRAVYAVRGHKVGGKSRLIYMHRVIAGTPDGFETDHEDGDGLNNMRVNLRTATRAQNQHNQRKRADNMSGVKGVSWDKRAEKWRADIRVDGKRSFLGYFDTTDGAKDAYARASQQKHGSFGRAA